MAVKIADDKRQTIIDGVLMCMSDFCMPLRKACAANGVGSSTFIDWCNADPKLSELYARARQVLIDKMEEDLLDTSDAPPERLPSGQIDAASVAKQRLQVDTRKWLLSKLAPRKFGDKVAIGGADDLPPIQSNVILSPDEAYKRLLAGGGSS